MQSHVPLKCGRKNRPEIVQSALKIVDTTKPHAVKPVGAKCSPSAAKTVLSLVALLPQPAFKAAESKDSGGGGFAASSGSVRTVLFLCCSFRARAYTICLALFLTADTCEIAARCLYSNIVWSFKFMRWCTSVCWLFLFLSFFLFVKWISFKDFRKGISMRLKYVKIKLLEI